MQTYDIKTQRKDLYAPKPGEFEVVEVPPLQFLMVDGRGDPNTSDAYREAIEALYAASYAVRSVTKARLGRVHTVGPLEGLWSADEPDAFRTHGLAFNGRHPEIYLSDARKTEPARLRTILRQPVSG